MATARALARLLPLLLAAALSAGAAEAPPATVEGALDAGAPRVRASLVAHPDDPPSTGRVRIGVKLEIAPGWHVYGPERGEEGLPTRVALSVEGGRAGPIAWPPTERFVFDGVEGHGYAGALWLPSEAHLEAARGADAGAPLARAEIELLACRERCIPARISLARALDGSAGADAAERRALFAPPPPASRLPDLLAALALGFLGGLLLNAMPCVLPVLAIKLAWLAELRRLERGALRAHGLAYAAGILASLLALAAATLLLRAGGDAVGWGFQLQDPRFVAALAALLTLLAANLFGAFEFGAAHSLAGLGGNASGARRSFVDGLLAVALATPCTAPFLGAAVGFALAGSALDVLAVFAAIGAGLAAPVALVVAVPGAIRWIPRSGAWMLELRRLAGLVLLATVAWLLFVLNRLAGPGAVSGALALCWLAAAGAHVLGWRQRAEGRVRSAATALALALGALLVGSTGVIRVERVPAAGADAERSGAAAAALAARAFDASAVAAEVATGRPAFVYFTADWCVTCKVNEHLVLSDARVHAAVRELGIGVWRADWTRRDEAIRAELARFGRAGVPAYLVYATGRPDAPRVLPELLSVDLLVGALRDAARS